jgi:deoxycytidylate deaminase
MILLFGKYEEKAIENINIAAVIAKNSTCERSKCGSIIVQANEVIGIGFNNPPGDLVSQKRCLCSKDNYDKKVTDKTCCIHAEQRAMISALKAYPDKVVGSSLYFVRIKEGIPVPSGNPYCTICSKMALDLGIKEFILWQSIVGKDIGVYVYDTEEYNDLSYKYKEQKL